MGTYDERPWLPRYRDDYPHDVDPEYPSALAMFSAALERSPDTEIIRYFDGTLTLRELDRLSDQFAVALTDRGFEKGHRLATYLQNIPLHRVIRNAYLSEVARAIADATAV